MEWNGVNAFFGGITLKNMNNNEWKAIINIFISAFWSINIFLTCCLIKNFSVLWFGPVEGK